IPMASGRGCCALAILLTIVDIQPAETGNYTVTGLQQREHPEVSQNEGTLTLGFPQEKIWVLLIISLLALAL
uniref:CD160 molecule n=1 Tax=Sciurus vulgaris TaxID=55149 RepID=A0A8D2APV4_SCIVU